MHATGLVFHLTWFVLTPVTQQAVSPTDREADIPRLLQVVDEAPKLLPVREIETLGWESRVDSDDSPSSVDVPDVLRQRSSAPSTAAAPALTGPRGVSSRISDSASGGAATAQLNDRQEDVPRVASAPRFAPAPAPIRSSNSQDLTPPRLLFDQQPIGSGVRNVAGPRVSQRPGQSIARQRSGGASAVSPRQAGAAPRPANQAQVPIRQGTLPQHIRDSAVQSGSVRLLLSGPNRFSAGVERDFQVVVINDGLTASGPLRVVMDPDAEFNVTVLDREAHMDHNSGAVIWTVPSVPAGSSEVIRFKGVADSSGTLVHVLAVVDERTQVQKTERFSTEVIGQTLHR